MTEILAKESKDLITYIKQAFAGVPAPEEWKNLVSLEDFQKTYGDDFFSSAWDTVYSWDLEEIRYFIPFAMEFYILYYRESPEDHRLQTLMFLFQQFDHKFEPIRQRLSEIYDVFSTRESKGFCEFFKFIKKYDLGYFTSGDTDRAISYWCKRGKG